MKVEYINIQHQAQLHGQKLSLSVVSHPNLYFAVYVLYFGGDPNFIDIDMPT